MAGLYIHIPFCKSRCIYCGFYSTTRLEQRQKYVDALCKEMILRRGYRSEGVKELRSSDNTEATNNLSTCQLVNLSTKINTIYLGGGTPSQLSIAQLEQLFIYINKVYSIGDDGEVTMECNPDDITDDYAQAISRLPINRVSMGVQTFDDNRLRFLRRRHSSENVYNAVERLRQAGINNISIDLMYGFPNQTVDEWRLDIEKAISLNVEHISAYSLMFEEGTPLFKMLESNKIEEADEEQSLEMFNSLIDTLTAAGYEHYEISNFAKPGFRSRHNSSYWQGIPYIGIGAAAHSYDIKTRQWNVSDIDEYIKSIDKGIIPMEYEPIDDDTRYNDTITTALRTAEGIDMTSLSTKHRTHCHASAETYIAQGLLELKNNRLRITRKGIFVSDMIMSDLMLV
ncbi:MAG: radical SAM family heme chaperone HemW [Prevotella sp.]|nr:radical SAM family heme chaperone HemW [Prevotella sp.]